MKIYLQETNKSCGIACLRSIFNYYGNNFSEKDIWDKSKLYYTKSGEILNPVFSLGVIALKFGFEVKYIGYNPIITSFNSSKNLGKSLKEKSKKNFDYGKYYVDQALEFLRIGGKIKIDKLNLKKIKKVIDENSFILVEVRPAFVSTKCQPNAIHKVIVVGYTQKGFRILDPGDGKEHLWGFDTFLLAFYASNPELLIINIRK